MARKGYKTATFTLPDGSRKYVYAKTKEELDEKVLQLKLQLKAGVDLSDRTTVGELIQMWYTAEVAPDIKANTAVTLKSVLNNHLMPLVAGAVAKDVTPLQVKLWLNETGKLNKHAARSCLRALRGSFELAQENGLIYRSPVLTRYKAGGTPYKKRTALPPTAEKTLLSAVQNPRAHLLVWMALATGMRRGELLGLMWDCVDFEQGTVSVKRNLIFLGRSDYQLNDYLKTNAGDRVLPIPPDLLEALRRHRSQSRSMFVFHRTHGEPFTSSTFNCFWRSYVHDRYGPDAKSTARIHGVVSDYHVTPHVLRHTYATRCFEAGLDIKEVQYLMGHSDPKLTLEIYTHYCAEARLESTFEKARAARSCTTAVPQSPVKPLQRDLKIAGNV